MKKVIITAAVFIMLLCSCSYNKNTSDISDDNTLIYSQTAAAVSGDEKMSAYDFSAFKNVYISGTDIKSLTDEELSVLYRQAEYCQAMTDAEIDTLRSIVSDDKTFTHMSGKTQSKEEYFADIADGRLNYYKIGIESPVITVNGDKAEIDFTSVLNANAYGARGTYRIRGTHCYEKIKGEWIAVNK